MSGGKSLIYKPGAGKKRDYWAIKKWLAENGITISSIADALGINFALVSQTIRGVRNTRRVLHFLLDAKCPPAYLSLPEDMKPVKKGNHVAN